MRRILKTILLVALLFGVGRASAQDSNPNNALLYSNQATLFGSQSSASDPVSIILPGTAFKSGQGSFIDNPASMALHKTSFGEFGLSFRAVDETATFLGNNRALDDNQSGISNIGFLYSFPTVQGSFVFGAGYTQHSVYNRALGFRGRNENNTITDKFKAEGSPYQEIAFNTFATDFGDEFEDWDESIFRIGFEQWGDFLGITQQGEIIQRGYSGEYSMFFATEFQENLMFGASIGLLSGRFNYTRIFQEVDEFNDYDSAIIDSNDDGVGDTDIDNILLDDQLRSRYIGFRARAGLIYRINDHFNIGGSYTFPTSIEVDEVFDANIRTTFNNGVDFADDIGTEFSYKIRYPSIISLGAGITDISGLSASFSTDYTNYQNTTIDFEGSELFEDELIENDFINENYRSVWSLRSGLAYQLSPEFTVRGGYQYHPSRYINGNDHKHVFGFGAGILLTRNVQLDLAAQYTAWDEVSSVYDYAQYDYSPLPNSSPGITFRSQEADRSIDRWHLMGTVRVNFQ
ncbi:MAG: outer membrane protein transport protein [Balneolaceae bacterium]|nr:outer membrane protein transport protein [Balneolaceae bacterium]